MPGGGAIALPIHTGDIVRLVDVEGMQRCEMVCADAAGAIDPAMLGVRGNSDASGLKQILSGKGESARLVRAGLERRGIDLSNARSITLFGGESRPGDSGEFTASRDGLLIVAAPGAPMDARKIRRRPSGFTSYAAGFARRMKCICPSPSPILFRISALTGRRPRPMWYAPANIFRSSTSPAANAQTSSAFQRADSTRDWNGHRIYRAADVKERRLYRPRGAT